MKNTFDHEEVSSLSFNDGDLCIAEGRRIESALRVTGRRNHRDDEVNIPEKVVRRHQQQKQRGKSEKSRTEQL